MMNKKGFTLVELMVVIVIIGVLAAVALPKFADAINKSRASEAPNLIGQIASAEAVYQGEQETYVAIGQTDGAGGANDDLFQSSLGVNTKSTYFTYVTVERGGSISAGFTATASSMADRFGGAAGTVQISVDDQSGKTNNAGSQKYIPAWK